LPAMKASKMLFLTVAGFTFLSSTMHHVGQHTGTFLRPVGHCASHARCSEVSDALPTSPEGWRTVLSPNQFAVLREASTEPPGFSETPGELEFELKKDYNTKYPSEGAYCCTGCSAPLYYAKSKFMSGCGWPAFYAGVPGAIEEVADPDGMRVEIICSSCKGHLGHVFKGEGFPTPTNERHCVNGICLAYDAGGNQPDDIVDLPAALRPKSIPE